MGDGGVACAPSQHVMATISETFCRGSSGGGFNSNVLMFADSNSKMELESGQPDLKKSKKGDLEKEIGLVERYKDEAENGENNSRAFLLQLPGALEGKKDSKKEEYGSKKLHGGDFKKGNSISEMAQELQSVKFSREGVDGRDTFLEKERGVEASDRGDVLLENSQGREIEKGGIILERLRRGEEMEDGLISETRRPGVECEKGNNGSEQRRKEANEKREFSREKLKDASEKSSGSGRSRAREISKAEFSHEKKGCDEFEKFVSGRERKEAEVERKEVEVEKGEFVPDRWKNGVEKGDIVSEKCRKQEIEKGGFDVGKGRNRTAEKAEFIPDKFQKDEFDRMPKKVIPHSGKIDEEDLSQRREHSRSCIERSKRLSHREASNDRDSKFTMSRIVDGDSGSHKHEHSDGKNQGREHSSGSWSKRDAIESENSSRRSHVDHTEQSSSKSSKRISEERSHSSYSEKFHSSVDRSCRNSAVLSKASSSGRHGSRHYEPSSKEVIDRRGRSPLRRERSPHDRTRHQHLKDISPPRARCSHERTRVRDHRDKTPAHSERSSYSRTWLRDHKGRSPGRSEQSPHDRTRYRQHREHSSLRAADRSPRDKDRHCNHHKEHSPALSGRSPRDQVRHHDLKDQSLPSLDQSHGHGRSRECREGKHKTERQHSSFESHKDEEKLKQESAGRDSHRHSTHRHAQDCSDLQSVCPEKNVDHESPKEKELHNIVVGDGLPSEAIENNEEFQSMEEDMDICDTPPHDPIIANSSIGNWFYLNHLGMEQGPARLCDLKGLVEDGFLQSDHLIKHSDSDRWMTVENASSPLVPANLTSIVSETVTQLVNPPEAPGNLLMDAGDAVSPTLNLNEGSVASDFLEEPAIDDRVSTLLKGYTVTTGKELEILGEALHTTFEYVDLDRWSGSEAFTRSRGSVDSSKHPWEGDIGRGLNNILKESAENRSLAPPGEILFSYNESNDWFSSLWSCKGGDWKRNDELTHDPFLKRKNVLNEGYPLCQMPKSGYEDPRWHRKDDLYHPSHGKRLDLPQWAFSLVDEKNETNLDMSKGVLVSRSSQPKPQLARVKGTILPVVRINACVVKDYGSFVSDLRIKPKGSVRHSSRSSRFLPSSNSDGRSSSVEAVSEFTKGGHSSDSQALHKCKAVIRIPKDHVCKVEELLLDLGEWYYVDGAGHERGPFLFSELQSLATQGIIPNYSSVFRKNDKVWVPITIQTSSETAPAEKEKALCNAEVSPALLSSQASCIVSEMTSSSFHTSHPQFIGYTRGKLHELVMKSYRSREFAAAINEVLDPWMAAKQPKKEIDKHFPFNSSIMNGAADFAHDLSVYKFCKPDGTLSRIYNDYSRTGKRPRMMINDSDEDEMEVDTLTHYHEAEYSFEILCGENASAQFEYESWGSLNETILARVFHFLRSDFRSLAFSAATCKCWNVAVKFYRDISRHVDLSFLGSECTDSMFHNIMSGYKETKVTSIVLVGCKNVTAAALEEVLRSFPFISSVDVRDCTQFREPICSFKNINWIRNHSSCNSKIFEESHSKIRSLKQITDKGNANSKAFRSIIGHFDSSDEIGDAFYDDSKLDGKDLMSYALRQNCYKRRKLLNARKYPAVLSRDAHMRWKLRRKSENGYKRIEEFLAISLKDIMKANKSEFFIRKVSEIEERMRNGYYVGHGVNSVKEDISRMCRDAIKAKNRGDSRDINHIIMLFIQLAKSLEDTSKSFNVRYDEMKLLKDSSVGGLTSTALKYKKKSSYISGEKRTVARSNGSSNGIDYGDYASDREIKRRLSKLNKRSLDSESETSDDLDFFEDMGRSDAENTASDTESDLDFQPEAVNVDIKDGLPYGADDSCDSIAEEREWGARMTKASLVPPVTRKYEVIDHYVILADEELVQRKMRVALPDDYAEKLSALKDAFEDSDMEIPEVKDYKPRKRLGDEVLEQEVYGIDPYTHNLLLDSMPGDLDWPQLNKHLFIEEVLLRALNKQARNFTGTGNTPMVYSLQPVLEEIEKAADYEGDARTVNMCQGILKAMHNRPEDTYVAYRKGLGVVCNKEGGFSEDDFVVEFLGEVYPAWKWFEKQDGIRSLQKNSKDPAPEFYNIYLERPKGDRDGYDLVVVDAMHKANYASRICHSCRPNCEAKVTAVDGQYQIGIYTLRPIHFGEEITFDYNSVTESKEEYEASVCLCGSQVCRGSYLNLTGEGAFQKVIKECHGILDRHQLMLEACDVKSVSQEDYIDLGRAGLGTCLLDGLPEWLIAYAARLVRFINFERTKLPEEILKHNLEEKRKFFSDICLDTEKNDAEVQAEGVYNQRLQNLALTLDKVRYVMRCVFGDARKAPPPLEKLSLEALVSLFWKGEGSLVQELLQCIAPHLDIAVLNDLKSRILAHDPSSSDDLQSELQRSLLWLRDEIRSLPCTYNSRHDAAADLIHMYAHTKCFFKVQDYKSITSPPVYISPLDLGPKYADKMGSGFQEYCKMYGENYCLGQLIYWHVQTNGEPDLSLARARRGCLSLPDISSFYAKSQKPSQKHLYGPRTLKFMIARMEKQPQRPWPRDHIWTFKNSRGMFGSPMFDAVLNKSALDREMLLWLKSRTFLYQATWDR